MERNLQVWLQGELILQGTARVAYLWAVRKLLKGLDNEERVEMASLLWSSARKSRETFRSPLKMPHFDVSLVDHYKGLDCAAVFSHCRTLVPGCKRNPLPRVCHGQLMRKLAVRNCKRLLQPRGQPHLLSPADTFPSKCGGEAVKWLEVDVGLLGWLGWLPAPIPRYMEFFCCCKTVFLC